MAFFSSHNLQTTLIATILYILNHSFYEANHKGTVSELSFFFCFEKPVEESNFVDNNLLLVKRRHYIDNIRYIDDDDGLNVDRNMIATTIMCVFTCIVDSNLFLIYYRFNLSMAWWRALISYSFFISSTLCPSLHCATLYVFY